ncbi:MAG: hypothetical protein WBK06_09660 [Methanothrix sp.]
MKYDLPDRNNKEKPPNYLIKCKGAVFQVLSSFLKFHFFLNGRCLSKAKARSSRKWERIQRPLPGMAIRRA